MHHPVGCHTHQIVGCFLETLHEILEMHAGHEGHEAADSQRQVEHEEVAEHVVGGQSQVGPVDVEHDPTALVLVEVLELRRRCKHPKHRSHA